MEPWFQEADATLMADAGFELIARTAVGMVEQLNPEFRSCHTIEIDSNQRVRGRYFTVLVHILFFMLDNAIQHSAMPRGRFVSKLIIRTEGNSLQMSVENQMSSPAAAQAACAQISAKVSELKITLDPAKVIKEGGTGFAKIIAAVRYEFRQPDPIVKASSNGTSIKTTVLCQLAGLTV